jgi:hypothetical protein
MRMILSDGPDNDELEVIDERHESGHFFQTVVDEHGCAYRYDSCHDLWYELIDFNQCSL